jgi:hypothetical protein
LRSLGVPDNAAAHSLQISLTKLQDMSAKQNLPLLIVSVCHITPSFDASVEEMQWTGDESEML